MNDDILQGKWAQLKGKVKEQWGKLTDDDIDQLDGRKDQLVGRVQTTGSTIRPLSTKDLPSQM
jgi:uncharacterized protein YjbJ (UPF0337 family)